MTSQATLTTSAELATRDFLSGRTVEQLQSDYRTARKRELEGEREGHEARRCVTIELVNRIGREAVARFKQNERKEERHAAPARSEAQERSLTRLSGKHGSLVAWNILASGDVVIRFEDARILRIADDGRFVSAPRSALTKGRTP
jgi:hypothetical protein